MTGNRSDEVGFLFCSKGRSGGCCHQKPLWSSPPFQWNIKLLWNLLISYLASWGWFGFLMGGGGHGLTSYPWTLKTLGKSQTVSGFVSSSLIASAGVCTLLPNACLCYQGTLGLVSLISLEKSSAGDWQQKGRWGLETVCDLLSERLTYQGHPWSNKGQEVVCHPYTNLLIVDTEYQGPCPPKLWIRFSPSSASHWEETCFPLAIHTVFPCICPLIHQTLT